MRLLKNSLLSTILAVAFLTLTPQTTIAHSPYCADLLSLNLPIVAQSLDYTCGAACFDSALRYWKGWSPGELPLAHALGTMLRGQTDPSAVVFLAQYYGLFAQARGGGTIQDLKRYLANGETVYVGWLSEGTGHYSLVNGMGVDHITLMDPWYAIARPNQYNTMTFTEFISNWYDSQKAYGQIIRISNRPLFP